MQQFEGRRKIRKCRREEFKMNSQGRSKMPKIKRKWKPNVSEKNKTKLGYRRLTKKEKNSGKTSKSLSLSKRKFKNKLNSNLSHNNSLE